MILYHVHKKRDRYEIYHNDELILYAVLKYGWFGKFDTLIYDNSHRILHVERRVHIFTKSITIRDIDTKNFFSSKIQLEMYKRFMTVIIEGDIYTIKSKFWGNPAWQLYKNDVEIGQINAPNKIVLGRDNKYQMVFFDDQSTNQFAIVSWLLNLYDMMD